MRGIYKELRRKEDKTPTELEFLKLYKTFSIVSEILVEESKLHLSSDEAIVQIRECMRNSRGVLLSNSNK